MVSEENSGQVIRRAATTGELHRHETKAPQFNSQPTHSAPALQIGQRDSSRRAPASPAMECATGSATSLQVPIMNSNPVASRIAAAVVVGIWILFAHVISNIFRYGRAW